MAILTARSTHVTEAELDAELTTELAAYLLKTSGSATDLTATGGVEIP